MKIIQRAEAKALGLKRYFTGVPCVHGHVTYRFVANGTCADCLARTSMSWRVSNPETFREADKRTKIKNDKKIKQYSKEYRRKNSESIKEYRVRTKKHREAYNAEWRKGNVEAFKQTKRRWQKQNLHKARAADSRRRAAKIRAVPSWADKTAIDQYYLIANFLSAELAIDFHVDHIVPLQSELVQGFHSQHNLSIALGAWNKSKSNRWWPDMP
jgi:hypothetical protein